MSDPTKQKFISDIDVNQKRIKARKPFKVKEESGRRYVRLEISTPISLNRIKDIFGHYNPAEESLVVNGRILNVSTGGVLVEIDQPLNSGDIVSMRFTFQDVKSPDNILGLVKRCDCEEDCILAGIEFVSWDDLQDKLSAGELELLSENTTTFYDSIHKVLEKYLYQEEVAG